MKTGITISYWKDGNKIHEYHKDAVRLGCKFYEGEQFDVLFNKDNQLIASYKAGSVHGVTEHGMKESK